MKFINFLKYLNITLALLALVAACLFSDINLDGESPYTQVIGNLHPLFLHLPIGGLIFALILIFSKKLGWVTLNRDVVALILQCTSFFANLSFFTGYILGIQGGFSEDLLRNHLWSAAGYTLFLAITAYTATITSTNKRIIATNYLTLALSLICMILAGHYGGLMTHGDPFSPLAKPDNSNIENSTRTVVKPVAEQKIFHDVVQPILEAKCYACHGNGKSKGKLALNTYEEMLRGGKDKNKTLIPGDAINSLLISTMLLPIDDDRHMPPAKKEQPTQGEINILKWWVEEGAPTDKTVASLNPPENILQAIDGLVPAEIKEKLEIDRLRKIAQQKENAKKSRVALHEKIKSSLPEKIQPLLRFVSPLDSSIHFSSVSLQGEFTDQDFNSLKELAPHMTAIDLSHSSVTSKTIEALKDFKNLESLRLANTKISNQDITQLTKLSKLKSLSLHSTQIDQSAFEHLADLKSLSKLYLWNTNITPQEIDKFKKEHPSIDIIH